MTNILGIISQAHNLLIALWGDSLLIFPFCQWKKRYKRQETACGRHRGMLLRAPWAKDLPPSCQQTAFSFRICSTAETHITHSHSLPGHLVTERGRRNGLAISALMWDNLDRPPLLENFPACWPRLWWAALWLLPLCSAAFSLLLAASISNNSLALQSPSQCLLWKKPTCNTAWSQVASKWWSWASDTSSLPMITIPQQTAKSHRINSSYLGWHSRPNIIWFQSSFLTLLPLTCHDRPYSTAIPSICSNTILAEKPFLFPMRSFQA